MCSAAIVTVVGGALVYMCGDGAAVFTAGVVVRLDLLLYMLLCLLFFPSLSFLLRGR